jgi:hypothetical protein
VYCRCLIHLTKRERDEGTEKGRRESTVTLLERKREEMRESVRSR